MFLIAGYVKNTYREGDKVVIVYCAEYNELAKQRKLTSYEHHKYIKSTL